MGIAIRITELAFSLREADPELSAWILAAQIREKEANKKRKVRKARLSGHGKAGDFYLDAEALKGEAQ